MSRFALITAKIKFYGVGLPQNSFLIHSYVVNVDFHIYNCS